MPTDVTDVRSNPNDQVAHAARVLGRSADRRAVFTEIYRGKRKIKRVTEIAQATHLTRVRVLQEGGRLASNHIVHQLRIDGETAYQKDRFYATNKNWILRLSVNPKKLASLPTKTTPRPIGYPTVSLSLPRALIRVRQLTLDEIDSFDQVKRIREAPDAPILREREIKEGIKRVLHERGSFQDWPGETNDLFTSRVVINGKRRATAFALKGPGKKGVLTPAGMGKNANQIQRLFKAPAEIFMIQYCGQVGEDVLDQMASFAKLRSIQDEREILYGVIDGDDTRRMLSAYPSEFGLAAGNWRGSDAGG